jgi:N6-adenosine-specific RNA methylase IME4
MMSQTITLPPELPPQLTLLELFARGVAPGWVSWGDQIERTLFNGLAHGPPGVRT